MDLHDIIKHFIELSENRDQQKADIGFETEEDYLNIGYNEDLDEYIQRIKGKLGVDYVESLEKRYKEVPENKPIYEFLSSLQLEEIYKLFAVYDCGLWYNIHGTNMELQNAIDNRHGDDKNGLIAMIINIPLFSKYLIIGASINHII